jgi:PKD repeat protein
VSSFSQNPVVVLPAGNHEVSLNIRDGNNCQGSVQKTITVNPKPAASFSAPDNQKVGCSLPHSVNFSAGAVTGAIYTWYFKNSTATNYTAVGPNSGLNLTRNFNQYGNYDVALVVKLSNGCKDSISMPGYIKIEPFEPEIFTSPSPLDTICVNQAFNLAVINAVSCNLSSDPWISCSGMFSFSTPGIKTISVSATNSSLCTVTKELEVYVNPLPDFTITAENRFGCELPFTTNVSYSPINQGDQVEWFVLNDTVTSFNPPLMLNSEGNFGLGLSVTDKNGCSNLKFTISDYLQLKVPDANFTVIDPIINGDRSTCMGDVFSFQDESAGVTGIKSWSWTYVRQNDATVYPPFSTLQNPQHAFQDSGIYWVKLTVEDSLGCTNTDSVEIKVGKKGKPHFYVVGNSTSLTELDPNPANSYKWSSFDHLADPLNYPKVPQVFCHYSNWADRAAGDSIYTRFHKIAGVNDWVDAWTFYWGESPSNNLVIGTFGAQGDSSSWNTENQKWVFSPDTGYSMLPDSGTFFLRIVTDHYGCKETLTIDSLIAILPPAADFTVTHEQLSSAIPITSSNELVVCPQDYRLWVDGNPITGKPLKFSPKESKYFIKHSGGAEDHSDTINNVSYSWNLGDTEDTLRGNRWIDTITHIYTNPGVYDVTLAIEALYQFSGGSYVFSPPTPIGNQKVCRDTLKKSQFIKVSQIKPSFTIDENIHCSWDTIKFTNTSIVEPSNDNDIYTLHWFFGFDSIANLEYTLINSDHFYNDGGMVQYTDPIPAGNLVNNGLTTNTFNKPNHVYKNFGSFMPTLIVTDIWNCSDTVKLENSNGNPDSITIRRLPAPGFYAFNSDGDTIINPSGCAPLEVNLTDNSIYYDQAEKLNWLWKFYKSENFNLFDTATWVLTGQFEGNDTAKVILPKGTHHAFYKITDTKGCSDSIWIFDYAKPTFPTPYFKINELFPDSNIQCWDQDIMFFNYSGTGIIESQWYFVDTSVVAITTPNVSDVSYKFDQALTVGNNLTSHLVKLRVKDVNECVNDTVIKVHLSRPIPEFFADQTTADCPPFRGDFYQNSSPDVNYWSWIFEGGLPENNTGIDPQVFYDYPGDYTVTLNVQNRFGCSDTIIKPEYIKIGGPKATIILSNNFGCVPFEVGFAVTDTHNIASGQWLIGGGQPYPLPDKIFIYDNLDYYSAPLIDGFSIGFYAIDHQGCEVTYSSKIYPQGAVADFSAPDFLCNPLPDPLPLTSTSRYWSVQDPIVSEQWIMTENENGVEVKLIVHTQSCKDTITKQISTFPEIQITGQVNQSSCETCADGSITLSVSNGADPLSFSWSNGMITQNINGLLPGEYSVTVMDANSCMVTDTFWVSYPGSIGESMAGLNLVNLYPNPANEVIHVDIVANEMTSAFIILLDAQGRTVYSKDLKQITGGQKNSISTSNISAGIYQLRIITDKGVLNKKVVVSH